MTYFHRITFSAGRYFALPMPTLTSAFVVLSGVGMRRTTLFAFSLPSKAARKWIVYSTRDFVGSVTCVCKRKGRLMLLVHRYLSGLARRLIQERVYSPHELELSIWRDEAD